MIDLTPLEVRQKKRDFPRSFRGYNPALVDDFIDLVADRLEELVKDNMALHDRLDGVDEELSSFREKEKALVDALMAAERMRDEARELAEKEARLLFKEAELEAEQHRTAAAQALTREESAIQKVKARRAQLVREFRVFLQRELRELTIIEESLELQGAEEEDDDDAGAAAAAEGTEEAPVADAEAVALDAEVADGEDGEDGEDDDEASRKGGRGKGKDRQTDWLSSLVEE